MPAKPKPRTRREDAYFGLHFDLHPGEGDRELGKLVTEEMIRKIIKAARPDYIQYDCKGHVGYLGYPNSKVSAVAGGPGGKGIVNDSLAIYRRVTEAHGVALLVHFSGVWDNVALKDHPEWAALKADGTPHGDSTSTFSPYVIERMIPQLKEVFDRYRVDGFWIDGDAWAVKVDYRPEPRARFKELTGQDEPPKAPGEPYWYEWMTIQRDRFFAYVKTYMDAIHAYAPGIQVASNWLYSPTAPEPVKMPVDFTSGDYSPSDSFNSARFAGRQMSQNGLPWDLMAWAFALVGGWGANAGHVYKPIEQLQQEAAAVITLGGGFQMYFHPDRHGGFAPYHIETMKGVADFCHPRREICHKTETVPQVALLLDTTSIFKTSPNVYSFAGAYKALEGALHAMLEAGHSVDVVADHQLPWQQDHWPVIVVPDWDLVPESVVYELVEYARRGGSLLVLGARTSRLFGEHLGVEFEGDVTDVLWHLQLEKSMAADAIARSVPMRGLWQAIKPLSVSAKKKGVRVLLERTTGMRPDVGAAPAAVLTPIGKGKIITVFGPLGWCHYNMHSPSLRDAFDAILQKLYRPRVRIDFGENPKCVDLVLREKRGRLIVHLVNTSAMPTSVNYTLIDRVPKLNPMTLDIRVPGKPRRIRLEPEGKRLAGTWSRGTVRVTVPGVHIHSAVVVE
jgi:hypothetical protein